MKIAVIGSTGLLGGNTLKVFADHDVAGFSRSTGNVIDFNDLENDLCRHFERWTPDVVINAVAIVNLGYCEQNPEDAYLINAEYAKSIASAAKRFSSYNIHISTDHFYDDNLQKHKETDSVKLLNKYAETKFAGEELVLNEYDSSLIARTNIVGFRSWEKPSFFDWLVTSLQNGTELNMYTDYLTSPVSVYLFAEILLKFAEKKLTGIYNVAGSEVISKFGFGVQTAEMFSFDKKNINTASIRAEKSPVKRAVNIGLDVSKSEEALSIKMPTVTDSLKDLYARYAEMKNEQ